MKFSTDFKKRINMRVGGLWDDKIDTQILLDSEVDNPKESTVTIDSEHVKCKLTIPNDVHVSGKEIREKLDSLLFYIHKENTYTYREVINALYKSILGDRMYSDELLCAVLNNEPDVDDFVYDESDDEQGEN